MSDPDDPRPLTAGVCGFPIAQSKSPRLFQHWFQTYDVGGTYAPLRVAPEDFADAVKTLVKVGFRGVNVTVPHKLAALAMADRRTAAAEAIGAANTLIFALDGTITADNTDCYGFMQNLSAAAPAWSADAGPSVILGAGGAARAAIFGLLDAGAPEVRLSNRTRETAEALADHFGERVSTVLWEHRDQALSGAATLINTTSLGMTGKPPLQIALDAAPTGMLVTDMVYNPLTTDLLAAAAARGLDTVDGLGMLLHQARPGFRAWFGLDPAVTPALRTACLDEDG